MGSLPVPPPGHVTGSSSCPEFNERVLPVFLFLLRERMICISRSLANLGFLFCFILMMLRIKAFCSSRRSGWFRNNVAFRN